MIAAADTPATAAPYQPATQRGRERREKILAAAETVFFEMGFEAASVSEIVRRSGGSLATLYKMFGTKEELFKSLVIARAQSIYDSLAVDRLTNRPPAEVLREIGRNFIHICTGAHGAAIFRMVMAEGARFPALRDIFISHAVDMTQRDLAGYFSRQAKIGALVMEDTLLVAKLFLEMIKGDLAMRVCCGEPPPSRRVVERQVQVAVDLFLHGVLPRSK